MDAKGRGAQIGTALNIIEYGLSRTRPFTRYELAEAIEIQPRAAARWLLACEARGLVKAERKRGHVTMWTLTLGGAS